MIIVLLILIIILLIVGLIEFNIHKINKELQYEQEAIEKLDKLIDVDEKNSGLIQVTVLMNEPELASDIANYIAQYVVNYVSEEQRKFASKTKIYLEDRLDLSKDELYLSENTLTEFRNITICKIHIFKVTMRYGIFKHHFIKFIFSKI